MRSSAFLQELIELTDIPMSCCLLHSDCKFLISASVFLLNDAVFRALFIFVLNAAISLQPLAYTPDPSSVINNAEAKIFFIINLHLIVKGEISLFPQKPRKKFFFLGSETK